MTAPELLPCPLCGGEASHNGGGGSCFGRFWWTVGCKTCDIWVSDPEVWDKKNPGMLDPAYPAKWCIAAWNRRTPSPEVAALIAEARREAEAMTDGLVKASAWVSVAAEVLAGYNRDLGVDLPDTTEIGRIDESRDTPSFRITVGHIRILAAAIRALKEETP